MGGDYSGLYEPNKRVNQTKRDQKDNEEFLLFSLFVENLNNLLAKKNIMKTLKFAGFVIMLCVLTGSVCEAQTSDLTVIVKGIKEVKGKIMIAAGDKSDPESMTYDMVDVTTTDDVTCVLKNVPDKPLNEKESMELIARMIQNTQRRLERGAGVPTLIWGYATILATLTVWVTLTLTSNHNFNYLWFLIPVIGITGMLLRKRQPKGVRTYVDKVVGYIWLVLGTTGFLLSMLSIMSAMWNLPILFIIIVIMGIGSVMTGLVTEFKPCVFGGIAGLLMGVLHYLIRDLNVHFLTFAFAFLVMFIIFGHILNYRAKKACLKN